MVRPGKTIRSTGRNNLLEALTQSDRSTAARISGPAPSVLGYANSLCVLCSEKLGLSTSLSWRILTLSMCRGRVERNHIIRGRSFRPKVKHVFWGPCRILCLASQTNTNAYLLRICHMQHSLLVRIWCPLQRTVVSIYLKRYDSVSVPVRSGVRSSRTRERGQHMISLFVFYNI